jgi:hypothetical protein
VNRALQIRGVPTIGVFYVYRPAIPGSLADDVGNAVWLVTRSS